MFGFIVAPLLDRFTRKKALLASFAGFIVGTVLCGLAPSYGWLMAARILAGCFGGISNSLIMATIADAIPLERRGTAMGIVMTSFSLASVVGVPLGIAAANHLQLGWRAPFLILGALSVALWILASLSLPGVQRVPRVAGEHLLTSIRAVFAVPRHWLGFAFTATLMFAGFVIIPFISPTMVQNVGLSNEQLPYIYLVGGACTFVSMPLIGKLADIFGLFRMFMITAFLSIPFMLIVTHLGPHSLWHILPLTTLFMVTASGRVAPAFTLVTGMVEPRHRAGFLSVNTAFQNVATGLAAMTAALIVSQAPNGYILHYGVTGWVGVMVLLLSLFLGSRIRRAPQA